MLAASLLDIIPAITREWRDEMAVGLPTGVTANQYRALYMINTGLSQGCTLARGLGVSAAAMSKMLDGLERGGFVDRTPSEKDRRHMTLSLTRMGESVVQQVRRKIEKRLELHFQFLSPTDEARIEASLKLLQRALAQKGEKP